MKIFRQITLAASWMAIVWLVGSNFYLSSACTNPQKCYQAAQKAVKENKMNQARWLFVRSCNMKHMESCYQGAVMQKEKRLFQPAIVMSNAACFGKVPKSCEFTHTLPK